MSLSDKPATPLGPQRRAMRRFITKCLIWLTASMGALSGTAFAAGPGTGFITTWDTTLGDGLDAIEIRVNVGSDNFNVYWGDGTSSLGASGNVSHVYSIGGIYDVEITGDFAGFRYDGNLAGDKIIDIKQWGDVAFTDWTRGFSGVDNLSSITAIDEPDLSNVTSFEQMFFASAFNGDISGWDTSNITTMQRMFRDATAFNQNISGWNTSSVVFMQEMFINATSFDQNLGGWNVGAVTKMDNMLNGSDLSVSNYDATLNGWNSQVVQSGFNLGAVGLVYSVAGQSSRSSLISSYSWNIKGDSFGVDPLIVTTTNDSGLSSLREAIDYANSKSYADNIIFNINGFGPHTITLSSPLPMITDDGVSIDGTTQSGASCGDLWAGTPHTLKVRVASSGGFLNAFELNGSNISLRGLSITNNSFGGVAVIGGTNQSVSCSYLGLTPAGTAAPNQYGVVDRGVGTLIGGPNPGDGNVISSNQLSGVISMIAASATTIEGNFIGTDPLGMSVMPNGQGIGNDLASGSVTWNSVQGNLVSGNSGSGIFLTNANPVSGSFGDAVISGNYIGVDRTGNTALANGGDGIHFEAGSISGVTIGGVNPADRNIISGNVGDGIEFSGVGAITILGNSIGLGADGTAAVGNAGTGVSILAAATGVQVGNGSSTGANVITNNGADGIYSSGDDFFALANNIYGNGGLGIDLGGGTEDANGVTANDSGDGDAGPNNLLNFPIINEVSVAGSTLNYDINLDAPSNANGYRVDFYKSTAADVSSYGEGEIHLGFVDITHAGGDLNFTGILTPNDTVAEGSTISTTTTRKTVASSYDMSSEFSLTYSAIASAAELTGSKSVSVYDPSGLGLYILPGNDVIYSLTVTNIGNGNADADTIVLMENVPPEISFYNGDMDDGGPILHPVSFMEGETTGLTFTYGTDLAYSNSGTKPTNFAACNFIPSVGYDNNVTYICVNPKGEMATGNPDPNFTIAYRARVN